LLENGKYLEKHRLYAIFLDSDRGRTVTVGGRSIGLDI